MTGILEMLCMSAVVFAGVVMVAMAADVIAPSFAQPATAARGGRWR